MKSAGLPCASSGAASATASSSGDQPGLVVLGEIAEHVAEHALLRAGMADAEAHPPVIGEPSILSMLRRPLCPAAPPPFLTRILPGARSSSSWNAVIASTGSL